MLVYIQDIQDMMWCDLVKTYTYFVVVIQDIIHVDGLPTMAGGKIPAEVLYGPEASVSDTNHL